MTTINLRSLVLKVASRCNLNCTYCYVYNQGDDTWRMQPALMSFEVFAAAIRRAAEYVRAEERHRIQLCFHGGEPCLLGAKMFDQWCSFATGELNAVGAEVLFALQTNGTLIESEWTEILSKHDVAVGISIDGPAAIHDRARVDHAGRGSYEAVVSGLRALRAGGVPYSILCVIPLGEDPLAVQDHLLSLSPDQIDYLLPDLHLPFTGSFGNTPVADFLIPLFDTWLATNATAPRIPLFVQIARLILGGDSQLDVLGGGALPFLFVEADGAIEGLDVLRVCANGLASTGVNVLQHGYADVAVVSPLHGKVLMGTLPRPSPCASCVELTTCGGGYLPHRYRDGSFDHSSYWCRDLLKLFSYIRTQLDVSPSETLLRRQALKEMVDDVDQQG